MFNQKILAEQGEVFKAPNGQIQKISNNAPSHDDDKRINKFGINRVNKGDGGVEIDADSVLSDSYRQVENGNRENNVKEQIVKIKPIEGESIAGQLGLDIRLKKAVSPSQLFLAIQKAKDKKTLSILGKSKNTTDTREGSNSNAVNASQLSTLPTDEEIYNAVFEHTEDKKESSLLNFEEDTLSQYGGNSSLLDSFGLIPKGQFGGSTYPFTNMQKQNMVSPQEKKYRNPEKKFEKESTGDSKLDFIYENSWLLDTPVVGDYLKSKAKNIAEISAYPLRNKEEYGSNEKNYNGQRYTGTYSQLPKNQQISLLDVFFDKQELQPSKYKPTSDYLEFLPSYSLKNKNIKNIKYLDGTTFEDKVNKGISNYIKSGKYDVDSKKVLKMKNTKNF